VTQTKQPPENPGRFMVPLQPCQRPLQWRMVRMIGPAIGQDEAAVDAIAYAVEHGWLLAAGNPAHSICLSNAGRH
jgi:hypothetical protein